MAWKWVLKITFVYGCLKESVIDVILYLPMFLLYGRIQSGMSYIMYL